MQNKIMVWTITDNNGTTKSLGKYFLNVGNSENVRKEVQIYVTLCNEQARIETSL